MNRFEWPVRVYYEDTDAGGVVYYANYLKYMERCRTEWLRALGFEQDRLRDEENVIFAVRSVQVDYRLPARFNDALTVHAAVSERGGASMTFRQSIRRGDELLCDGEIKVASLRSDTLRPRPMPSELKRFLDEVFDAG